MVAYVKLPSSLTDIPQVYVTMGMSGWLVVHLKKKDVWKYAWMRSGGQFVITHGQVQKPTLSVDSWDTPNTVSLPAKSWATST